MTKIAEFAKTTLTGGFLILLPIYLSILLLAKMASAAMKLIAPVTAAIAVSDQHRQAIAVVIIVVVCFVAGLVLRTGHGRRALGFLERHLLEKIPGYALVRGLAWRAGGAEDGDAFAPALVELEDGLVPAMIIEELPDARYTVFVPSVPTPATGALYVLTAERIHRINVPLHQLMRVYASWGEGTGALLQAMR